MTVGGDVREVNLWQDDPSGPILSPSSDDLAGRLNAARGGDLAALGELLEAFRPYLASIAERDVPTILRGKCDGADIVQDTLMGAHRGFSRFGGRDVAEFRAWLRGILKHVIVAYVRRYRGTYKRTVGRELSLDSYLDLCERADELVAPDETPHTRIVAKEEADALKAAIERLPLDQKVVILLRIRELLSFKEIGRRLSRTPEAARKLWCRAVDRLQRSL